MLAAKQFKMTEEDVGTFYWLVGQSTDGPVVFRRAAEDAAGAMDETCMAELTALARQVIEAGAIGFKAIAAMAREVGLHQRRAASRGRLEKGIQIVIETFDTQLSGTGETHD